MLRPESSLKFDRRLSRLFSGFRGASNCTRFANALALGVRLATSDIVSGESLRAAWKI
jgi:hypothetical protein